MTNRELIEEILQHFDLEGGEWPGIEVFSPGEGRPIWGFVLDDLRELLFELRDRVEAAEDEINWEDD